MKILFINGKYPFCYFYRGYLPGVYSGNYVVDDFMRKDMKVDKDVLMRKAKDADVIVFQRPQDKERLALIKLFKSMGKKVIFENDDTYLVGKGIPLERLENDSQREIAIELSNTTNEILSLCDGAIASTQTLANEYREINPNVAVLKNCIDPLDEFTCKENKTGKFRIGLIGSVTTNDDYLHIKDQIRKLDERGDITFVVFGIKYNDGTNVSFMDEDRKFWESLKNVEWQPYVHITEYMMTVADLALDLAIIPRQKSYFNDCKSNLKFLEMSLLKIPVLAEDILPYQKDVYLTLVPNSDDWYNYIIDVKDNYTKYKGLASKAHDYVLENYSINNFAPQWVKTIETLCK
jgi:glycosyltransferase involved in cell wall biosynthesis